MKKFEKKRGVLALLFLMPVVSPLYASSQCRVPPALQSIAAPIPASQWKHYPDLQRNRRALASLCTYKVSVKEGNIPWTMLLVFNPKHPKGAFWFLPHDNENSAFDSGIYAVKKYGGGMLSIFANGRRFFHGQDPNRNFGTSSRDASQCRGQKRPAPIYTNTIFSIIDTFRKSRVPYLALHNNADGYSGNGGSGTISILRSTRRSQAYPAGKVSQGRGGLNDEDSMVYIAGSSSRPPAQKIKRLHRQGIHVKYEWVDAGHNDCSMSNYVLLHRHTDRYYNLETEHGDSATQTRMIDRIMALEN